MMMIGWLHISRFFVDNFTNLTLTNLSYICSLQHIVDPVELHYNLQFIEPIDLRLISTRQLLLITEKFFSAIEM